MFKKLLKKLCNKEVILYLVFGVLTTMVDFIIFFISKNKFNIHYILSNCIAWFFAVLFAYVTNKIFVFEHTKNNQNIFREMFYFFFFRLLSLILTIIFMFIMVDIININEDLSKIMVSVFVVVANYFFSKIFIFKS